MALKATYLLAGIVVLSMAACASTPGIPTTGEDPSGLANTHWRLVSYGQPGSETPAIAGTEVTLQFEEEAQAGGATGCNTFGAQYEVSGGNQLSMTEVVSTLMACSDEAVMEQERQYLEALQSAESFELAGESLTIRYAGSVLNFSRITSGVPNNVNL